MGCKVPSQRTPCGVQPQSATPRARDNSALRIFRLLVMKFATRLLGPPGPAQQATPPEPLRRR